MRKPGPAFLAVIAAAMTIAGYLFLQLRAERGEAAQLREHVAQLEKAVAARGSSAITPSLANQALPGALPTVNGAPPLPAPAAGQLVTIPGTLSSAAIRKELGLTTEEAEGFNRLRRDGGSQAEFEALIGPARYEQYQEMQRTARREQQVSQFRTSLATTSYPLADGQIAQLDPLLAAEQRRRIAEDKGRTRPTEPRARLEYDEARLKATQVSNDRVLAAARSFLSPEQSAVLRNELGNTVSSQQDSLRIERMKLDAGGR